MPNYCHNKLIIESKNNSKSKKEFEMFKNDNIFKINNEDILSFKGLIPFNDEFTITKEMMKKYSQKDPLWYIHNLERWGTKWDAITNNITYNQNIITIHYDTAWAPGEKWLDVVAKTYKNLVITFSCYEEGGYFDGDGKVENGKWIWKINRPSKTTIKIRSINQI